METLPPPRRVGRLGGVAAGLVTVAGLLTATIELYRTLYNPPDKVQIELQQQPIRVELVSPPAPTQSTPAQAITKGSTEVPQALPLPIEPARPSPANQTVTASMPVAAAPAAPAPAPALVAASPAPSTQSTQPAESAPLSTSVGPAAHVIAVPPPSFRITTIASTNETDGPRGRAALSFDGDPATFYTFMAKSDPTVITVVPAAADAMLKELRYKVPAGIQLDNLVTELAIEAKASNGESASFLIQIDPYREGWQTVPLALPPLQRISLRPQVRYNGRLMSIGEIELR